MCGDACAGHQLCRRGSYCDPGPRPSARLTKACLAVSCSGPAQYASRPAASVKPIPCGSGSLPKIRETCAVQPDGMRSAFWKPAGGQRPRVKAGSRGLFSCRWQQGDRRCCRVGSLGCWPCGSGPEPGPEPSDEGAREARGLGFRAVAGPEVPEGGAGAGSWIRIRHRSLLVRSKATLYHIPWDYGCRRELPGGRPAPPPNPGRLNPMMKLNSVSGCLSWPAGWPRAVDHPRTRARTRGAVGALLPMPPRPLWADGKGLTCALLRAQPFILGDHVERVE